MGDEQLRADSSQKAGSGPRLSKSISLLGFFGLGLSAIFGASWLLTTGIWIDAAGGPYNALGAFVLCFLVELPFILAYYEAVPMIPLAGGELSYSYLSFGSFVGMMVGWFGVLVNIILCAWEALAISRLASYLVPGLGDAAVLYEVLGSPITLPSVLLGLALVAAVFAVQYRGARMSARFGTSIAFVVCALALACVLVGAFNFDPANLRPARTKDLVSGTLSLLAMLPFSIAGWETVAKGAQEAAEGVSRRKIGACIIGAVGVATVLYILTMFVPAGLVPWQELSGSTAPFAEAMARIGFPVLGTLLIVAGLFGTVGVYNAVFFGATRMLYTMGSYGMVPRAFRRLHPRYKSPRTAILFVSALSCIVLFLGQSMFVPLIDVAAVAYIVLWGSTLASVLRLRRRLPHLQRPALYPGGKPLMCVGLAIAAVLLLLMLVPGSPASLAWPVDYLTLLALVALGVCLYLARDRSLAGAERDELIVGEVAVELQKSRSPEARKALEDKESNDR